jgi:hypothetical protein
MSVIPMYLFVILLPFLNNATMWAESNFYLNSTN